MTAPRPIGLPAEDTPLGKEYRHIATTMIRPSRCDRATAPLASAAITAPNPGAA